MAESTVPPPEATPAPASAPTPSTPEVPATAAAAAPTSEEPGPVMVTVEALRHNIYLIGMVIAILIAAVLGYQLFKFSSRISVLDTEKSEVGTRLANEQTERSRLDREVQRLNLALIGKPDLSGQVKTAEDRLAEVQAAALTQRSELESQITSLKAKLPVTRDSGTLWDSLPASLQDQAKSLGFTRDALKGDDTRTIRLSADNDRLMSENGELEARLRPLEAELAKLKADYGKALKELSDQALAKTKTEGQLDLSRDALAARDTTIADLKQGGEDLRRSLQTSLKASEDTNQSLRNTIKELEAALKSAKSPPPDKVPEGQ